MATQIRITSDEVGGKVVATDGLRRAARMYPGPGTTAAIRESLSGVLDPNSKVWVRLGGEPENITSELSLEELVRDCGFSWTSEM